MVANRSARASATLVVLLSMIGACGSSTRAAATAAGPAHAENAAAESDDDDDAGAETERDTEEDTSAAADDETEERSASATESPAEAAPCPKNMVLVASGELRFCIDMYEASLVEVDGDGNEKPHPHWLPVDGHTVRAVSEPGVFPQGYISEVQSEDACTASGKRLCSVTEWKTTCMGPSKTTFPYGNTRNPGACHDTGRSAVAAVFGLKALADPVASAPTKTPPARARRAATTSSRKTATVSPAKPAGKPGRHAHVSTKGRAAETTKARATRATSTSEKRASAAKAPVHKKKSDKKDRVTKSSKAPAKASQRPASVEPSVWTQLNDPRLGQVEGALARTGSHGACVNDYGAFDMVGNIHEWVKTDPSTSHGTFAGGYYLDTWRNGDGCNYRTTAHAHDYHDYSTGFRCCADPKAPATPAD
ncbi:MAG TPA: hypothetical protein VM580_04270 [Labilithrix sp.]|nr:hypothetical protein [Labilithrix sp.]